VVSLFTGTHENVYKAEEYLLYKYAEERYQPKLLTTKKEYFCLDILDDVLITAGNFDILCVANKISNFIKLY
jgi:hypothetical protein